MNAGSGFTRLVGSGKTRSKIWGAISWDLAVGVADHFEFGIEVVDVVKREGLGRARQDGRAELVLAVMAADQVEQVQAHVLIGRAEALPCGGLRGFRHISPEFVGEFDAQRDVAHHLAVQAEDLVEAVLGITVFPQLAAIMEQHAC